MKDFLFRGSLPEIDPDVHELTNLEAERQYRRIILIPSESTAPLAVRQAVGSSFHNVYAEGYPAEASRWLNEEEILDFNKNLGYYRRFSDLRFYKGVEYANVIEALARRRCAETFAANGILADDIFVNVQPLSGSPANNAVYHALVQPGDTVMGLDLLHGGHLSHGSSVNRSGKLYNIVHYTINEKTEKIDYDELEALAKAHEPKMIIAGFSSYPWKANWTRFRQIADKVGAYLLADISHVAGLIAGGVNPSPVGHAHVITSTTHKTLCGPRGAIIMTTDRSLSRKIDRAVFPGEQGGPHVNVFAGLAIAFKLAQTKEFRELQKQIVKNCKALTENLEQRGFKIPFGGTDTHIMNLDMNSVQGPDGSTLSGDQAARILDLAGIVVNRNTIPGDRSALNPSGIRMGTPWITQRGFKEKEVENLAGIIANLLQSCTPYRQASSRKRNLRAKVDFDVLQEARLKTRDLAISAGIDFEPTAHGYPHFNYIDDKPIYGEEQTTYKIEGARVAEFLSLALSSNVEELKFGESQGTSLHAGDEKILGTLKKMNSFEYLINVPSTQSGLVAAWLRDLSDGFIYFDEDLLRKLPGPVSVQEIKTPEIEEKHSDSVSDEKPYFIGIEGTKGKSLPAFVWQEPEEGEPKLTPLNKRHRDLGAKMVPFAGWDMPIWYSSVVEEHLAVRKSAGLFDVSHMGVYQAEGPEAGVFLNSVCGNDIGGLHIGQSIYTHFLDPDANVIDDLLVYRQAKEEYLLVVNASNDDKDWAWLNAVREGKVLVDNQRPWAKGFGRKVILRNLRSPNEGKDMRVDIALQGPKSRDILLALGCDKDTNKRLVKLRWAELCEAKLGEFDLIVSRTGYTGEKMAFELFVHPEKSVELWIALLRIGEPLGLKPCGLAARDSLRTEAGLPLYGHEMGGEKNLGVGESGFRHYVKTYKPWFIGREAFIARETQRKGRVVRFKFSEKGIRMAHSGDPVVDKRGKTIGFVTSCAVDSEGLLTGQAFVDFKSAKRNTPILIFSGASNKASKPIADLVPGDKVGIPNAATVIKRFL